MQKIEQTLSSLEVAEMVEKEHSKLLRDLRKYEEQFAEAKIGLGDFFQKSNYLDANNQPRPCYLITLKGCEFIAHKLTGIKGTIFTARYINRFHEMQDIITRQADVPNPEFPWFIRQFRGQYVILERDFIQITGVDITKHKYFYGYFTGGLDYNNFSWYTVIDKTQFYQQYGFEYGDDVFLTFFYLRGAIKALKLLTGDNSIRLNPRAYQLLKNGIDLVRKTDKKELCVQKSIPQIPTASDTIPPKINISITLGDSRKVLL